MRKNTEYNEPQRSPGLIEGLASALKDGTLTGESLELLIKEARESMRRKEILSQHTPPIKQLPSGRYYTRINGKKIEKKNLKDVEDEVIKAYRTQKSVLTGIFDDYLTRRKMVCASTTWCKDLYLFNTFVRNSALGSKAIAGLTLDDGYAFLKHCFDVKPDIKRKYWNNITVLLNGLMQYCIEKGLITVNPFSNLKVKKDFFAAASKTRDGDTVFTRYEQAEVCRLAEEDAEVTSTALPLAIVLLFQIGLRDGELCALKWSDVETGIHGQYLHVQREMITHVTEDGKTRGVEIADHCKSDAGDRRLILNAKAESILKRVKELNDRNGLPTGLDDFIFLRTEKGDVKHCTSRSVDSRLRKYCRKAGMTVIKSPHDIRRTVLTNLYLAGMPLTAVKAYAGHSSLAQTLAYIRVSDDDLSTLQFVNTLSAPTNEDVIPISRVQNQ